MGLGVKRRRLFLLQSLRQQKSYQTKPKSIVLFDLHVLSLVKIPVLGVKSKRGAARPERILQKSRVTLQVFCQGHDDFITCLAVRGLCGVWDSDAMELPPLVPQDPPVSFKDILFNHSLGFFLFPLCDLWCLCFVCHVFPGFQMSFLPLALLITLWFWQWRLVFYFRFWVNQ